jgi:hypothetical protein
MGKSKDGSSRASHIQPLFEPQDAESFRRQCSETDAEAGCKGACQETCKLQCKSGCEIVYK